MSAHLNLRSPARPLAPARAGVRRRAVVGAVWTLAWTLVWGSALMMFAHRAQAVPSTPAASSGRVALPIHTSAVGRGR